MNELQRRTSRRRLDHDLAAAVVFCAAEIVGVLNAQFHPTDLNTTRTWTPDYSSGGDGTETDVIYQGLDLDGPGNTAGIAFCEAQYSVGVDRCDQHYAIFDNDDWPDFPAGLWPGANVICHETGHAVGLVHGQNAASPQLANTDSSLGCMRTLPLTADSTLGALNTGAIDATY